MRRECTVAAVPDGFATCFWPVTIRSAAETWFNAGSTHNAVPVNATGYAINPARDLAPRIAHAILPFKSPKRDSGWSYSWIPVLGPIAGAAFAALTFALIF